MESFFKFLGTIIGYLIFGLILYAIGWVIKWAIVQFYPPVQNVSEWAFAIVFTLICFIVKRIRSKS